MMRVDDAAGLRIYPTPKADPLVANKNIASVAGCGTEAGGARQNQITRPASKVHHRASALRIPLRRATRHSKPAFEASHLVDPPSVSARRRNELPQPAARPQRVGQTSPIG